MESRLGRGPRGMQSVAGWHPASRFFSQQLPTPCQYQALIKQQTKLITTTTSTTKKTNCHNDNNDDDNDNSNNNNNKQQQTTTTKSNSATTLTKRAKTTKAMTTTRTAATQHMQHTILQNTTNAIIQKQRLHGSSNSDHKQNWGLHVIASANGHDHYSYNFHNNCKNRNIVV